MKRIFSLFLLTVTLLTLFSCNRSADTDDVPGDNRSTVFRGETVAFPDGWGLEMTPNISYTDGTLTAVLRHQIGENEYGASIYETSPPIIHGTAKHLPFPRLPMPMPKAPAKPKPTCSPTAQRLRFPSCSTRQKPI